MEIKRYEFNHLYLAEFLFSCGNVPCISEVVNDDPAKGPTCVSVQFPPDYGIGAYLDKVYQTLEDRYKGKSEEADKYLEDIPKDVVFLP